MLVVVIWLFDLDFRIICLGCYFFIVGYLAVCLLAWAVYCGVFVAFDCLVCVLLILLMLIVFVVYFGLFGCCVVIVCTC